MRLRISLANVRLCGLPHHAIPSVVTSDTGRLSLRCAVLEGIGIIEKKSKNNIKWRQEVESGLSSEQELAALRNEHDALKQEEAQLDAQISTLQDRLRELASGEHCAAYAYVTHNDIKSIPELHGDTLIAIKAPPGTELEVPDPDEGMPFGERRYQIFLKSTGGPIDCLLVSQGGADDYNNGATPLQASQTLETGILPTQMNGVASPARSTGSALHDDGDLMGVLRLSPGHVDDEFYFGLDDSRDDGPGIADLYDEVMAVPEEAAVQGSTAVDTVGCQSTMGSTDTILPEGEVGKS